MQDIFIEYMVKKQNTPQRMAAKALVVLAAVVVSLVAFLFSGYLGGLSFLMPVIVIGAFYGAYYVITSMNVEFEYSVTNGELDVDQIIAQRKRKRLISVDCRSVEKFGRFKPEEHSGKTYGAKIMACDSPQSGDLWYCVSRMKESGMALVVFNANQKMLEGIKPFLPRPIMHEAFKVGR